jgi:hypothetical protein
MSAKSMYWLVDADGNKAVVEGRAQRDRWTPLGWADTEEPSGHDRLWLRHGEHGGRALFPFPSMPTWAAKGWAPSDPPAPEDSPARPAEGEAPAPNAQTTAAGGDPKES